MKLFNNITLISLIAVNLALPTVNDGTSIKSSEVVLDTSSKSEITDSKLSVAKNEESSDATSQEEEPIDFEGPAKLRTIFSGFRIPVIDSVLESTVRPILEGAILNPFNNIVGNNNYDEQAEEDMREFLSLIQNIKH